MRTERILTASSVVLSLLISAPATTPAFADSINAITGAEIGSANQSAAVAGHQFEHQAREHNTSLIGIQVGGQFPPIHFSSCGLS